MRLSKLLALLTALCLLISMFPAAISEDADVDMEGLELFDNDADLNTDGLEIQADDLLTDVPLDLDEVTLEDDALTLQEPAEDPTEESAEEPLEDSEEEAADDAEMTDEGLASNNANYTNLSNSTEFTLNGVTVRAGDFATEGSGNCWSWAQKVYKKIWGCNFDSTFAGTAAKGHNLLRNLTDDERKLTPENLKYCVSNAKPGATLRVQSCPSTCSGFNGDGCSKHEKHSLIIAEIREDGLVTMDDQGSVHTRYYTWEGFCNSWKRWVYIKYIKWPNAPALTSSESIDGIGVSKCSVTYKVRSAATKGIGVYSLPTDGKLLATLKYPATFNATAKSLKTFSGYTWVHGTSSTGTTGWMPLTDAVASPDDTIKVTGISLDNTTLYLAKGGKATLKAAVVPADATDQKVNWTSSDTSVATVSDGSVTAVNSGTATITATSNDGSKTATCTVRVSVATVSKELTVKGSNGTVKIAVGTKLQLIPTFATSKGWKIKSVSSSKTKYATVNKYGVVTAKKVGTTTITVKTKNGKKATLKVKVVKSSEGESGEGGSSEKVDPKKIVLNKTGTVKLKVGKTMQLYTKLSPSNATTTLTWASSDSTIAYVDNNGKVYGKKRGKCKIGVKTSNDLYAWVTVKVK